MTLKIFKIILPAFLIILFSCNEEEVTEPTEENLLLNTSFEENGVSSAEGWKLPQGSEFSTDVPPNGGSFSLKLIANSPPEYAYIMVPVKTQYTVNRLKFWSKATNVASDIYGEASLSLIRNGAELKSRSIQIDVITWTTFSIQDTFDVAEGDSFKVQFSGGITQLFSADAYFDLVQLQGIK